MCSIHSTNIDSPLICDSTVNSNITNESRD